MGHEDISTFGVATTTRWIADGLLRSIEVSGLA
jgi:hypothetical protein